MPDQIILLLHSVVFALSNNSTEVKNESVGWQEVARNIGCPKERIEKEKAIKEKEIIQKKMDEMQAQLEMARAKVGDVVSVDCTITPSAGKVRLKLL